MPAGFFIEILSFVFFGISLLFLVKSGKREIFLFLILPFFMLESSIEFMSIHLGNNFIYSPEKFSFMMLGLSPAVLSAWLAALATSVFLTEKLSSYLSFPFAAWSIFDAAFVSSMNTVLNPILAHYGWILYEVTKNYPIDGFFLGVPLWEFIGAFVLVFIVSLVYRSLKNLDFSQRIIITYGYVFSIVIIRFLAYRFV